MTLAASQMASRAALIVLVGFAPIACGSDSDDGYTPGADGSPQTAAADNPVDGAGATPGTGAGGAEAGGGSNPSGTGQTTGEYCVSGLYAGMYDGLFMDGISMAPFPVSGPFDMTLDAVDEAACGADEEFCFSTIAEGAVLTASYGAGITMVATMEGAVNCETGVFEAASSDCMADVAGTPSGCSVEMNGMFDPTTGCIEGTFDIPSDWGHSTGDFSCCLEP